MKSRIAAAHLPGWRLILAGVALICAVLTYRRNEDYRSALSIWSDTVAKRPSNALAQNEIAVALTKLPGRESDALPHYGEALRISPDFAEAQSNLGIALMKIPGRETEAVEHFEQAVRIKPDYAKEEKQTDVNIALQIVRDVQTLAPDFVVIMSGDIDLLPALDVVMSIDKKVRPVVYIPVHEEILKYRRKDEFMKYSEAVMPIPEKYLRQAQFPVQVQLPNGNFVERPLEWAAA